MFNSSANSSLLNKILDRISYNIPPKINCKHNYTLYDGRLTLLIILRVNVAVADSPQWSSSTSNTGM